MIILDTIDKKILALLAKQATYSSALARVLEIPRTTISFRLGRLQEFQKVSGEVVGRKTIWRIPRARIHNKSHYRIFEGNEFLECYKAIETLPPESTVYAVQGKGAADVIFKRIPEELIKELHRTIKRKRIIMHAIANKSITKIISTLNTTLKKSHVGRIQGVKLVDGKFLSSAELFITPLYISIINPDKKIGILIKDPTVISLIYDFAFLFFALSDKLETFDLNRFIQESL